MILTKASFDVLREKLFDGSLTTSQVQALNFLVEECDKAGMTYPETAYSLATVYHETGTPIKGKGIVRTMQPISEVGSDTYLAKYDTGTLAKRLGNTPDADGDGQLYKGRGYTQITGTDNYRRIGKLIGIDLISKPERALEPKVAATILTQGMLNGWFTGVGFRRKRPVSRYNKAQYIAARTIINGTDKAELIAGYALIFEQALRS